MSNEIKSINQGFWREHSAAWKASGMTKQAYCEQHGLSYRRFIYQHNRLVAKSQPAAITFTEAKQGMPKVGVQTTRLHLTLPNGIRIGVGTDVDATQFQMVLSIAGGIRC